MVLTVMLLLLLLSCRCDAMQVRCGEEAGSR